MASKYQCTEETTNFAKIAQCIVGPCTDMLRELLHSEVQPSQIKALVQNCLDVRTDLTYQQREKLHIRNSTPVDYRKFDISLLYRLFRTPGICTNIAAPTHGWGKPPKSCYEISVGDDLERLRLMKDDICSHTSSAKISSPRYCDKIRTLKSICSRFDINFKMNYEKKIDSINMMCMDPEMEKKIDKIFQAITSLIKEDFQYVKSEINYLKETLNSQKNEKVSVNRQYDSEPLGEREYQSKGITPAEAIYPRRMLRRLDELKIKKNYSLLLDRIFPLSLIQKAFDREIISQSTKENIRECQMKKHKTDKLLKSLLRSYPQSYTDFLDILRDTDEAHREITGILEDTEITDIENKSDEPAKSIKCRLESNHARIIDEIEAGDIVSCFLEEEIISLDEHDKVFYEQFRESRANKLMSYIQSYLPWSFTVFLNALRRYKEYKYLVQQIIETDIDRLQTDENFVSIQQFTIKKNETVNIFIEPGAQIKLHFIDENGENTSISVGSKKIILTNEKSLFAHGFVDKIEKGCLKIVMSAASPLFVLKIKHACESEEIKTFIRQILEAEGIDLTKLPKTFRVDIQVDVHTEEIGVLNSNDSDIMVSKFSSKPLDFYDLLTKEVEFADIESALVCTGVIDEQYLLEASAVKEDKFKQLMLHLTGKDERQFMLFLDALHRSGYSYIADILLQKELDYFNNMSDDGIRITLVENYNTLLGELDTEHLKQGSGLLASVTEEFTKDNDGTRRNKVHLLLKGILQKCTGDVLRSFLQALNNTGYQHVLEILRQPDVISKIDGYERVVKSGNADFSFKGQLTIQKEGMDSRREGDSCINQQTEEILYTLKRENSDKEDVSRTNQSKGSRREEVDNIAENTLFVVVIDFGTTFSGFAYASREEFKHDHSKINLNNGWNDGTGNLISRKTPTCLLLTPNETLFGYDAENKFTELASENLHKECFYFRRFKMKLFQNDDLTRETEIEDETGHSMLALDVFETGIRCLKDTALAKINSSLDGQIESDEVHWIITVPAIWNDKAREFMFKAADKAGLKYVSLVLEPEAAAIYCKEIKLKRKEEDTNLESFPPTFKFMVVDLGGGTVDVTVHEVSETGSLKELYEASGGPWGGTEIEKEYMRRMEKVIGEKTYRNFSRENVEDKIFLERLFELQKRSLKPDDSGIVVFRLPLTLVQKAKKKLKKTTAFKEGLGKTELVGEKLKIEAEFFKSLFDSPVSQTIAHLRDILQKEETREVSTLLLVGGFAQSEIVQRAIQDEFPEKVVIIPNDPEVAVMKGAVILGQKMEWISSRKSRHTYGIGSSVEFDPEKHPKDKRKSFPNSDRCIHIFHPIVKHNEDIIIGKTFFEHVVYPEDLCDKGITISIYVSENKCPKYVTDPGCKKLGNIYIPFRREGEDVDRPIKVKVTFNYASILMVAVDDTTKKTYFGTCDFLGEQ